MKRKFSGIRKKSVGFNPDQKYIDAARAEYLANGGGTTYLEATSEGFDSWMCMNEPPSVVDDFLNGE